jgi:2-dehydro-3-deoxyphosphogluconate aldolase/(4S)-4-hydroxy-2-oxoglutarate aldolase
MTKAEIIDRILNPGIVAIIRADSSEHVVDAAGALFEGGVLAIEVTMNTPNALQAITAMREKLDGNAVIGVGTVLDAETARAAILAGAQFVVTPATREETIRICNRYGKPIISGAFTPTECLAAHEYGADFVKFFPAEHAGLTYIKNILAALPMLRIIPTGGVTVDTVADYLSAGCVALAAGSSLVNNDLLNRADWKTITARASALVAAVCAARTI